MSKFFYVYLQMVEHKFLNNLLAFNYALLLGRAFVLKLDIV